MSRKPPEDIGQIGDVGLVVIEEERSRQGLSRVGCQGRTRFVRSWGAWKIRGLELRGDHRGPHSVHHTVGDERARDSGPRVVLQHGARAGCVCVVLGSVFSHSQL